jgi:hypothetical protein
VSAPSLENRKIIRFPTFFFSLLMKMRATLLVWGLGLLALARPMRGQGQAPGWQWAAAQQRQNQVQYFDPAYSNDVAVDAVDNVYVAGSFEGELRIGTTLLTSRGGRDMFVAKYAAAGNLLWVQQEGGTGDDEYYGLALTPGGSPVLTGMIGPGGRVGSSTFGYGMVVSSYTAQGGLQWVRHYAGGVGYDMTLDASGNAYVVGGFSGELALGSTTLRTPPPSLGAGGVLNGFVAKLDASGTIQWAQQLSSSTHAYGANVSVDPGGAVYVCGNYSGDVQVDGLSGQPYSSSSLVLKLTAQGTPVWLRSIGSPAVPGAYPPTTTVRAIAADGSGVVITGQIMQTINFDALSITSPKYDAFVARYDAQGTASWVQLVPSTLGYNSGNSVVLSAAGDAYVAGVLNLVPGTAIDNDGNSDSFVAKYDLGGTLHWLQQTGGATSNDAASCAVLAPSGDIVVSGWYAGPTSFGATTLNTQRPRQRSGYVARLSATVLGTRASLAKAPLAAWPNPSQGAAAVQLAWPGRAAASTLRVLNPLGQLLHTQVVPARAAGATLSTAGLPAGRYVVQLLADDGVMTQSIIVE